MAGFLYFRSGNQRPVTKDVAAKLGLAYAFPAGIQNCQVNANSPSKSQGNVFADPLRHEGKRIGYFPGDQTWRKMPNVEGRGELWVGYWNDAKPGPADLKRRQLVRGPQIRLADGNAWQIPIVRRFDDAAQRWECELPSYFDYDDEGKIVKGEPRDEYASLWDATAPLADQLLDGNTLDEQAIFQAVEALLQANYVVGLPELMILRTLADNELIASICMVATRYTTFLEWCEAAKKKSPPEEASGGTSVDGEAA
jgi:hypothetical protein